MVDILNGLLNRFRLELGVRSAIYSEHGMAGKTVRFPRGTMSLLELRSPGSHLVPFSRRSL
ncbi:hypothetical protein, partial [Halobacillus kuroshimensis]|uniref:hypothetical protein n=1 Tax=Halobacillus kuroshimensis TaxID=302481 RepID=UPI001A8DD0B7